METTFPLPLEHFDSDTDLRYARVPTQLDMRKKSDTKPKGSIKPKASGLFDNSVLDRHTTIKGPMVEPKKGFGNYHKDPGLLNLHKKA